MTNTTTTTTPTGLWQVAWTVDDREDYDTTGSWSVVYGSKAEALASLAELANELVDPDGEYQSADGWTLDEGTLATADGGARWTATRDGWSTAEASARPLVLGRCVGSHTEL